MVYWPHKYDSHGVGNKVKQKKMSLNDIHKPLKKQTCLLYTSVARATGTEFIPQVARAMNCITPPKAWACCVERYETHTSPVLRNMWTTTVHDTAEPGSIVTYNQGSFWTRFRKVYPGFVSSKDCPLLIFPSLLA